MKLWLMNPAVIGYKRPSNNQNEPEVAMCTVTCPCGICGRPFPLLPIAEVTFPAIGAVLTQLQWRLLLNGYTIQDRIYRVLSGADGSACGWGGRIVAGRVFNREAASENDQVFGRDVAGTLNWIREHAQGGSVRVR